MTKNYTRKTNWVPQDERRLSVRTTPKANLDVGQLAQVYIMHALTQGMRADGPPGGLVITRRQYPFNRARLSSKSS